MADNVADLLPELVVQDESGFKAVAYARATAVVAEAVKELRQETNDRFDRIIADLANLREEIKSLRLPS